MAKGSKINNEKAKIENRNKEGIVEESRMQKNQEEKRKLKK